MSAKLRYVLPAVQMALAVGLLWWTDQWFKTQVRLQDMPGPAPAFSLLISINAPVALPRALLFRHVSASWDYVLLVFAAGALWYWAALNIESLRREGQVLMFHWVPLRLVGDLLLIAIGVFWGLTFVAEAPHAQPRLLLDWLWAMGIFGPLLAWSLMLIFFFGRDFIRCVRGARPAQ